MSWITIIKARPAAGLVQPRKPLHAHLTPVFNENDEIKFVNNDVIFMMVLDDTKNK